MTRWLFPSATALALVLSNQSAAALTAEEAWTAVQAMSANSGQTMTAADAAQSGDTLTVSGIQMAVTTPDGPLMQASLDSMVFRDRGDGTVMITYSPSYDIKITIPDVPTGSALSYTAIVAMDQIEVIASGSVEAPIFDFTAATVPLSVKDIIGADGKPIDGSVDMVFSDFSGSYAAQIAAESVTLDSNFTVGSLTTTLKFADANSSLAGSFQISDLALQGKNTSLAQSLMQSADIPALLAAGFMVDSKMTTGPVTMAFTLNNYGVPGQLDGTFTGTSLHVALANGRMDYGVGVTGGKLKSNGFDVPLPEIASDFGEVAFGLSIPIVPSETPQDFSFLLKLVDLNFTEDLWATFDPGRRLRRDPITLIVDLDGTGRLAVNQPGDQPGGITGATEASLAALFDLPAMVSTLDLTEVVVRLAGAQMGAVGSLTFLPPAADSFSTTPQPEGTITVTLDGINAVLDALVGIGIISQDDMMGARMVMGMYFRPGASPDQLVTDVEFRNGGMLANGQQIF